MVHVWQKLSTCGRHDIECILKLFNRSAFACFCNIGVYIYCVFKFFIRCPRTIPPNHPCPRTAPQYYIIIIITTTTTTTTSTSTSTSISNHCYLKPCRAHARVKPSGWSTTNLCCSQTNDKWKWKRIAA